MNPEIIRPGNGHGNGNGGMPMPYYVDPVQQSDGAVSTKLMLYAIFKRKWQVLGLVAVVVLSIVASGLFRSNVYKTTSKVMLRPGRAEVQLSAGDQREITLPVAASTEMINSEMEILKSQELMRQAILRMKQANTPIFGDDTTLSEGEQIAALQGMMAVSPAPQSNVIAIDLFAKNPEKGRAILSAITNAYLARHAQLHGSTGAAEFFESQKQTLRERVADSEARLAAFVDRRASAIAHGRAQPAHRRSRGPRAAGRSDPLDPEGCGARQRRREPAGLQDPRPRAAHHDPAAADGGHARHHRARGRAREPDDAGARSRALEERG
jgi:capsular polysaccharide biosynthesis protein